MYCVKCGKEVADGTKFCTNCGAEIEAKVEEVKDDKLTYSQNQTITTSTNPTPVEAKPTEAGDGKGTASLVLGIVSFIVPCVGAITAIVGLILGICVKKSGKKTYTEQLLGNCLGGSYNKVRLKYKFNNYFKDRVKTAVNNAELHAVELEHLKNSIGTNVGRLIKMMLNNRQKEDDISRKDQ